MENPGVHHVAEKAVERGRRAVERMEERNNPAEEKIVYAVVWTSIEGVIDDRRTVEEVYGMVLRRLDDHQSSA